MARLIVKSPYIKCSGDGSADGYMRYIATRERVELLPDDHPPTHRQERFIKKLMKDYPDVREVPEYAEYEEKRTKAHASAFISSALENHWGEVSQSDVYMKYIATRPGVILSVSRLLHHMSKVFWESLPSPRSTGGHVESKLLRRIREKKIAMGHKADDHEEQQQGGWNMTM